MNSRATRFTLALAAIVLGGYAVGALAAQAALHFDPDASGFLLERGPGKLMRRITMIVVVLGVPLLLRRYAWQGWRDNGITMIEGTSPHRADFIAGLLAGIISLGLLAAAAILVDQRMLRSDPEWLMLPVVAIGFLLRATLIGVLEEVLARGILFRSLARLWPTWCAALFTSLFFATGHFLKPQDPAFAEGLVWPPIASMFHAMGDIDFIGFRLVNMVLMSLVLCVAVVRRKTIWLAAGLHAGWVFIKAVTDHVIVWDPDQPYGVLWGRRSDYTDSLTCFIMLSLVMVWVARMPRRTERAVGDT